MLRLGSLLLWWFALVAACGARSELIEPASPMGDASQSSCASTLMCWNRTDSFAAPKHCRRDSDCVIVRHVADCCGGIVAYGVRADALASVRAGESLCSPGACRCVSRPRDESGAVLASADDAIAVCDNGCCVGRRR